MTRKEYGKLRDAAIGAESRQDHWLTYARESLAWYKVPQVGLDSSEAPFYRWFPDGEINMSYQAIDRHVDAGHGERVAIAYESVVGGASRNITYSELKVEVENFAAALREECNVQKGDRVLINMPMVPEALVAMLACTRVGAVHSVVFGGFGAAELAVRIDDATPKVVVSASGGLEGLSKVVPYGPLVEAACKLATHRVDHVVFKRRPEVENREAMAAVLPHVDHCKVHDYDDLIELGTSFPIESKVCVPCSTSDPLYILYTSGTTGAPKGVVRDHTHPVALKWSMDKFMRCQPGEVYWSASDIGWVVGHSFIVYGPLIQGCTTVLFEGKPVGTPDAATYWRVIDKYKVTTLFTAPTALRAIRKEDPLLQLPKQHDLTSLRTIFVAGERADPGTIDAYGQALGVAMIDNWWQTETGWPIAGLQYSEVGVKSGSCSLPLPGFDVKVLDAETKKELPFGELGSFAIKLPFPPGTMQSLYNNDKRFLEAYLTEFGQGYYNTGDAGYMDKDGYIHVMARTDDVINTAGHRLSTGQIEEIISSHHAVAECAVVGAHDAVKGQVPIALLVLNNNNSDNNNNNDNINSTNNINIHSQQTNERVCCSEVVALVREKLGPVAAFKSAAIVPGLPKTRSGKILRGVIQKIADGRPYKLPGTIEDEGPVYEASIALRSLGYPSE